MYRTVIISQYAHTKIQEVKNYLNNKIMFESPARNSKNWREMHSIFSTACYDWPSAYIRYKWWHPIYVLFLDSLY